MYPGQTDTKGDNLMNKNTELEIKTFALGISLPLSDALEWCQPEDPHYERNNDLVYLLTRLVKDPSLAESLTDNDCDKLYADIVAAVDQASAVAPDVVLTVEGDWTETLKAAAFAFCEKMKTI